MNQLRYKGNEFPGSISRLGYLSTFFPSSEYLIRCIGVVVAFLIITEL